MAKNRKKTVVVFGTFDLLHPGHIAFICAAARHGDVTVVVTPDVKVRSEKGQTPFFLQRERLTMVAALRGVARAVLGDRSERWTVVERLAPDVICVGHDQREDHPAFLAQLAKLRKRPVVVRLRATKPRRYASSKVKLEIHRTHRSRGASE